MIDAIETRRSVRTYEKKKLSEKDKIKVRELLESMELVKGPFGNRAKWFYRDSEYLESDEPVQIGTYGMVKNPPAFVGGAVVNSFQGMVDYGYLFEYIILNLTKEGFGTVWLGATFDRKAFNDFLKDGEVIPAVSVVGYTADHKSLVETFTRMGVKANHRKPFPELFFEKDLSTPLTPERKLHNRFSKYLDLVRLAPSGTNQQPWRVITHGNLVHFYLKRTPNYAKSLTWDIQAVDIGIALSHFELGLKEDRLKFLIHQDSKAPVIPGLEYVATFEVEP